MHGGRYLTKITYKCSNCGRVVEVEDGNIPECCGEPMDRVEMEPCIQPAHAEHTRPMDSEDACDDGRAG